MIQPQGFQPFVFYRKTTTSHAGHCTASFHGWDLVGNLSCRLVKQIQVAMIPNLREAMMDRAEDILETPTNSTSETTLSF